MLFSPSTSYSDFCSSLLSPPPTAQPSAPPTRAPRSSYGGALAAFSRPKGGLIGEGGRDKSAEVQAYAGETAAKVVHFINGAQGDGSFFDSAARGLAEGFEEELHVLVRLNLADLLTEFMGGRGTPSPEAPRGSSPSMAPQIRASTLGSSHTSLDSRIFTYEPRLSDLHLHPGGGAGQAV